MRCLAIALIFVFCLQAQQPEMQEMLDALTHTADLFSRTAPYLSAREVLDQQGRYSEMTVLRRDRHNAPKQVTFRIPEKFELHHVVSEYSLGSPNSGGGFHELRRTVSVDGEPVAISAPAVPIRHTLVAGAETPDDETKHTMLEELQFNKLQGAATDFGPLLLLFTTARRSETEFNFAGHDTSPAGPVWVLRYRQTAAAGALTEFRNSRQLKHLPEGTIWLREGDLLPLRINLETEEYVTSKYLFRNQAEVEYRPTPFGLAPHLVVHRQLLNGELLVENRFSYSAWRGQEIVP